MLSRYECYVRELKELREWEGKIFKALPKAIQQFHARWVRRLDQELKSLQSTVPTPSTHQPTKVLSQE